ncbi:23S rRNA pseudouridine synthase F [Bacillus sp. M6-12]|uniref:pseudouridine synthase n=1 Tax=Bacillus sp. M6-12 TaxID=2054166 RepID=UPI000C773C43|nr:23S rRNA pseudouridine(2604) synthase RluF [Bacillus sp. M6-12]PLS18437.1 23S rRNA pseudouridine synthase F [Bacillus sp. M6-12]
MRIQKYISLTGYCSRRTTDKLIKDKRVTINGAGAVHDSEIAEGDEVLIDGSPIPQKGMPIYLALNKPPGITCTAQPNVPDNLIDFINYPERVFPVGRLDKASEGLILLTNDGDIVNKMMRSEHNHSKEYIVTVDKHVTEDFLERMAAGVKILGTVTKPCETSLISEYIFRIVLTQGLNRQIRRMSKELGYRVLKLKRVRIMNIELGDLPSGQYRHLNSSELEEMKKQLD